MFIFVYGFPSWLSHILFVSNYFLFINYYVFFLFSGPGWTTSPWSRKAALSPATSWFWSWSPWRLLLWCSACRGRSSACAVAPGTSWKRSWLAWQQTPGTMPLRPIRWEQEPRPWPVGTHRGDVRAEQILIGQSFWSVVVMSVWVSGCVNEMNDGEVFPPLYKIYTNIPRVCLDWTVRQKEDSDWSVCCCLDREMCFYFNLIKLADQWL